MSGIAAAEMHANDGDQKNAPESEQPKPIRFEEGKDNSHIATDSKDERSIANKLAAEEKKEKDEKKADEDEMRPTDIAKSHGNKPSRGAKIDQQIEDEERAELERKGKA